MSIYRWAKLDDQSGPDRSIELMNISLVNDLPLFIDPFLLFNSRKPEYRALHDEIISYLRFLRDRAVEGTIDDALLEAGFTFREVKQNWLGFLVSGMWFSRMSSTRPPCGSTTVTPAPAAMSVAIMFRRSVDLPAPVAPKIAMCLRRASGGMAKASPWSKMPSSLMPIRSGVIIEVNALKFTGEGIAEQTDSKNCISGFAKQKGGCRSRYRAGRLYMLCVPAAAAPAPGRRACI